VQISSQSHWYNRSGPRWRLNATIQVAGVARCVICAV